jgi:peptidoglycan/xylan/chitin deacetylase (PgdA/CDA1 family)
MIFEILKKLGVHHFIRFFYKKNVTILCLHQISDQKNKFFPPISPETFDKLIYYLNKYYTIIHFNDLDHPRKSKKPYLVLSFDDGYYDFIENALPILRKYNLKSNHNVVNQCLNENATIWTQKLNLCFEYFNSNIKITELNYLINKEIEIEKKTQTINKLYNETFKKLLHTKKSERDAIINFWSQKFSVDYSFVKMMSWKDLEICINEEVEIGSHTYTHDSLITLNTKEEFDNEINRSIEEINEKLKINTQIISLPNGQINNSLFKFFQSNNFKYILLVLDGINHNQNYYDRVYLIDEKIEKMISRVELIPQTLRKCRNILFTR